MSNRLTCRHGVLARKCQVCREIIRQAQIAAKEMGFDLSRVKKSTRGGSPVRTKRRRGGR